MPIYTYSCPADHIWDELRTMRRADKPSAICPTCGLGGKRRPAPFNAQFNGSGWTPTHYPNRGKK